MRYVTCRERQGIVIGEQFTITIVEVLADSVRLGITSHGETPAYWEHELAMIAESDSVELQSLMV